MTRMLRLKLEIFDYLPEQDKPDSYNREWNKQTALEMLVENTRAENARLIAALNVCLKPEITEQPAGAK